MGSPGAALVMGCFSFSIREFGIAAPLAVVAAAALTDKRHRVVYMVAGASVVAVCVAIYIWSTGLPGSQSTSIDAFNDTSLRTVLAMYFTLSFGLCPLAPFACSRATSVSRRRVLAGLMVTTLGCVLLQHLGTVFVGNYLSQLAPLGTILWGAAPTFSASLCGWC